MARKRYEVGWLFCLILILQSCGNDASFDAVILPETQTSTGCTFTGTGVTGPILDLSSNPVYCQTVGAVQFHVQRTATDTTPVGDADVRIDIGNSVGDGVLLLNSDGTACFNGGDPTAIPTPSDCLSLDTKTDKFGVISFKVRTTPINGCGAGTSNITSSTFVQVTISNSHATWQMDNTITCS